MSSTDVELGPIDYLIVEWPPGTEPTGEGLRHLVDLTERGLIRVIDLAFVKKEEDGTTRGLAITDLDEDGSLDLVIGTAASGERGGRRKGRREHVHAPHDFSPATVRIQS